MDDPFGPESGLDEGLRLSLTAALSQQYAADSRSFLAALARMLETAMPDATEVRTRGGLFSRRTVQQVAADIGDNRYILEDPGRGPLRAWRTHIVRGIVLKNEEMPVPDWIAEVGVALGEQARTNAATREALSRFTGQPF